MFVALNEELEKWAEAGKVAEFWWRDDDAQALSPALTQLLDLSEGIEVPLALAAIPDGMDTALAIELSGRVQVCVLQHGFDHRNHAPERERKMELGWHRSEHDISAQLRTGHAYMYALFGAQFLPVLVPPWNRIDPRLVPCLHDLGFNGLSTLGPRKRAQASAGLKQVNVHVDIIDWKNGRSFAGVKSCIDQMVTHLRAKRQELVDPREPTGIMSHHLVHDRACWDFLAVIFSELRQQENAVLLDARDYFIA